MKLGRPLKGSTRRNPITIYAPEGTLEKINEFIEQREAETGRSYSRSDFYQEAALALFATYDKDDEAYQNRTRRIEKQSQEE